ncbi:glycosyltransferase family 2 protein [Mycetocola zhadangensis]|uniref:Glycosyltransferase family 2 protein n=2 Tax=Mycetocola zhadangensis TaxID=1164595 RepID=A0A3L7ITP7_9MICO|nr:glycosyltransferase family 2 protein [Mycetocola zhadangensis]RLQ82806.1 glycosyltransferase family 2 protein [Mycetocola zhadangensis]
MHQKHSNLPERSRPLVSVVVPAYNNAEYLEETIESVLAQTYENLEIVIADHSSTDRTLEIMNRYAGLSNVKLLSTEAGGGALRNWNRVSQAATGEYIKLVCGDDLLYPWIIEEQVSQFLANPSVVLVASSRDIVDAHNKPLVRNRGIAGMTGLHRGAAAARKTVREGTNIFGEPGCVLMRRASLEAVGWWDSRFPYLIDEATYIRVLLTGDFVGIKRSSAGFRVSDSQWSVRLAKQQVEQATGFHRWLATSRPDVVSSLDLRVGNARARLTSAQRRLAYVYLSRRMSRTNDRIAVMRPERSSASKQKDGSRS